MMRSPKQTALAAARDAAYPHGHGRLDAPIALAGNDPTAMQATHTTYSPPQAISLATLPPYRWIQAELPARRDRANLVMSRKTSAAAAWDELIHRARWLRSPLRPVTRAYTARYGLTVRSGPFAGLRYQHRDVADVTTLVPKLLGSYESELHAAVSGIIARSPLHVVNAGCADGYYAVGLVRRLPSARVHAFDLDARWQSICRRTAQANGVGDRVMVGGRLDVQSLRSLPLAGAALIVDCDGCEAELFSPASLQWLEHTILLVELHEFLHPGITARITKLFDASHHVELIDATPRWVLDHRELTELPKLSYVDRELGISEFRPSRQQWALLTPRQPSPCR